MTHPGHDVPSAPGQPPYGATAAGAEVPAQPAEKSGAKKWLPIAGSVAVAGVLGAGALTNWFGIGEPKVGDCAQMQGETSFEVVDCGSDEAEFKIVGIQDGKQSYEDFQADPESCIDFATAEVALWTGAEGEDGTVYCGEPV